MLSIISSKVDIIFFSLIIGSVALVVILYFVFRFVDSKKGQKPSDGLTHKKPVVEETIEEPVVEETIEEPVVEETIEEPVVEETIEEPVVEETIEEPVVEETIEEPVVEETIEEPVVEETIEEPVVEETVEESVVEETVDIEKKGRSYNGKYEVFPEDDYYKYQLKASNGEILFVSELYTTRDGAIKSIEAVRRNVEMGTIRIIKDKRDMYKFKLIAKNHRTLVIGANYTNEKSAINASESFKRFAVTAEPVDIDSIVADVMDPTMTTVDTSASYEKKTNGKYTIEQDENGEFIWALRASNGEILVSAEGYASRSGALTAIESFKEKIPTGTFYCSKDKRGTFQFKLYSKSGRVSAIGESYDSKARVTSAVQSVLAFYEDAELVDTEQKKSAAKKPVTKTGTSTAKKTTTAAKKPAATAQKKTVTSAPKTTSAAKKTTSTKK